MSREGYFRPPSGHDAVADSIPRMDKLSPPVLFLVLAGFVGGIVLFLRGLVAYRRDRLISSIATSSLEAIAAGEVRVSGVVEAIHSTLISPLQSKPCVWYRARVEESGGDDRRVLLAEERATQFRIKDERGAIRVLPQGARWEIVPDFDESTSLTGAEPPGLHRRAGARYAPVVPDDPAQLTELERQAAIQALLTAKRPESGATAGWDRSGGDLGSAISLGTSRGRRYREARLEPGDVVTIIGQALPWSDVREELQAWGSNSNVERAITEDLAAARAAGLLASSPDEAWGNAAIPGFGIGKPTQRPELAPEAQVPEVESAEAHEEALERHEIPPEELVVARGPGGSLAVYKGTPQVATQHHDFAFFLGIVGAVMTVACALALGAILSGSL